jgi:hypothetical membrane protein
MPADRLRRASVAAGALAPVLTLGAIFAATLLSPSFSWTAKALSNLGGPDAAVATPTTRLLFNNGLLLGGLVGLGFGPTLLAARRNAVELAGVALFGLTVVAMALIGVFPQHRDPHFAVAVAFYVLLSLACWTYGAGNALAGARRRGLLTAGAGVANLAAWVVWGLTGPFVRPGLALPEIVGATVFGGWAVATSVDVRRRLGLG